MGTYYTYGATKADIKNEILEGFTSGTVLAHRTVGNHFWVKKSSQ